MIHIQIPLVDRKRTDHCQYVSCKKTSLNSAGKTVTCEENCHILVAVVFLLLSDEMYLLCME